MYLNKDALKKAASWFDGMATGAAAAAREARNLAEADDIDGYLYATSLTKVTAALSEIAASARSGHNSCEFGISELFSVLSEQKPADPEPPEAAIADADLDQVPAEALED